jgi:hypothetical protein
LSLLDRTAAKEPWGAQLATDGLTTMTSPLQAADRSRRLLRHVLLGLLQALLLPLRLIVQRLLLPQAALAAAPREP